VEKLDIQAAKSQEGGFSGPVHNRVGATCSRCGEMWPCDVTELREAYADRGCQLVEAQGKLRAVEDMRQDFNALLRDVHKGQYRQTLLDYPPADPKGRCHSLCRHVFLIRSTLYRILSKEGSE